MAAVELTRKAEKLLTSWRMVIAGAISLAVFSQSDISARAYGWIDPVVTPLQVTSIEPVEMPTLSGMPRTGSLISGEASIMRESCDYIDLTWKLQGGEKSVELTAFFEDPPEVRSEGTQYWRALIVDVPPDQLYQTQGYANHKCGVLPVSSPFYLPPAPDPIPAMLGATAQCQSGAYSTSTGSGTCSNHGGVARWINEAS